ncbi:hypothetical protein H6A14_02645 [Bifidobacterium pullorum subsp. saeculare]|uniref:hypothetical protein n=1 Tax=Bifidobacterium pullorum TaxID=78448 RepID=UPI0019598AE6|nr:hypothetical protein [Bifidobacterium pullorum]MBM6730089.1 hypothetical protein [Bifidobacterium pullorum subsp. saeculare]
MNSDIQIIADDYGLMVLGNSTDVTKFLEEHHLESKVVDTKIQQISAFAGGTMTAFGEAAQQSGRWVQLTEDSASKIKKFGLIKGKDGFFTGVIGKGGYAGIKGNVKFVNAPGTINPMMLANIGTLMAQIALQQMMDNVTNYLEVIDQKVDDVLRAQKDSEISKMVGAGQVIAEAMAEREQFNGVSEITWSGVQDTKQTLAASQVYALRQLDAFADKLERTKDIGKLADMLQHGIADVSQWIAVLARSLELQDGYSVLKLDRVRDTSPEELMRHRTVELDNQQQRIQLVSNTLTHLSQRIHAASRTANTQVLLHPFDSHTVINSGNTITSQINDFNEALGIAATEQSIKAKEWIEAAADARDLVIEKGAEGVKAISSFGSNVANHIHHSAQDAARQVHDGAETAGEAISSAAQTAGSVIGNTADAAIHGGEQVVSSIGKGAEAAAEGTASAINATVRGANDLIDNAGKVLNSAGQAAADAASDTVDAAGKVLNDTGKAIGDMSKNAGEAADKAFNDAGKAIGGMFSAMFKRKG